MREIDGLYKYICVYIDDLAIVMKDQAAFCEMLKSKHGYKLMGVSDLKYHLGCDFGGDPNGTYYYGPKKYAEKMMDANECMFGKKPMGYSSPLEKGDHPELDMSPELNEEGCALYMSLVGQSQWLISSGALILRA